MKDDSIFIRTGSFVVGCNYWASHAGTAMWSDWRPEVVNDDFACLAAGGVEVLRVFPLWPEFQPVTLLRGAAGASVEYRHGEQPLTNDEAGRAGISRIACERFATLLELAERYGLRLVVSLINGWMSGRLFVPPALEGCNVLTDPKALMWQTRFVRYFVHRFRDVSTIVAWDLGNECNVMGNVTSREEAWHWTATVANAIRTVDPDRPIISGMHSLNLRGPWTIADQAELTDVLTTHPYPLWTPYADQDPLDSIRSLLHATAETRLYADVGQKACVVEEIGTMGPMVCDDQIAAGFLRANLFSLWAHDCRGLLWWCAFDQTALDHAPYDWNSVERELGLFRLDRTGKPVARELKSFVNWLRVSGIETLPPFKRDAVCLLSQDQDTWGIAYSAFVLAKQAGFDVRFQSVEQPLEPASLYLLPCIRGNRVLPRHRWYELLELVERGATLYLSYDGGFLSEFEAVAGLRVRARAMPREPVTVESNDLPPLRLTAETCLELESLSATVLGCRQDGNPIFTVAPYGRGKVYFFGLPLERRLSMEPGAFQAAETAQSWRVYDLLARNCRFERVVSKSDPQIGVTEHWLDERTVCIVLINYGRDSRQSTLAVRSGWQLTDVRYGHAFQKDQHVVVSLPGCDAAVLMCQKIASLH